MLLCFQLKVILNGINKKYHYNVEWNFRVIIIFFSPKDRLLLITVKFATSAVSSHISFQSSYNTHLVSPVP